MSTVVKTCIQCGGEMEVVRIHDLNTNTECDHLVCKNCNRLHKSDGEAATHGPERSPIYYQNGLVSLMSFKEMVL